MKKNFKNKLDQPDRREWHKIVCPAREQLRFWVSTKRLRNIPHRLVATLEEESFFPRENGSFGIAFSCIGSVDRSGRGRKTRTVQAEVLSNPASLSHTKTIDALHRSLHLSLFSYTSTIYLYSFHIVRQKSIVIINSNESGQVAVV